MGFLDLVKSLWAGAAPTSPAGEADQVDKAGAFRTAALVFVLAGGAAALTFLANAGVVGTIAGVSGAAVLAYVADLSRRKWKDYAGKLGINLAQGFYAANRNSLSSPALTIDSDSCSCCSRCRLCSCGVTPVRDLYHVLFCVQGRNSTAVAVGTQAGIQMLIFRDRPIVDLRGDDFGLDDELQEDDEDLDAQAPQLPHDPDVAESYRLDGDTMAQEPDVASAFPEPFPCPGVDNHADPEKSY